MVTRVGLGPGGVGRVDDGILGRRLLSEKDVFGETLQTFPVMRWSTCL